MRLCSPNRNSFSSLGTRIVPCIFQPTYNVFFCIISSKSASYIGDTPERIRATFSLSISTQDNAPSLQSKPLQPNLRSLYRQLLFSLKFISLNINYIFVQLIRRPTINISLIKLSIISIFAMFSEIMLIQNILFENSNLVIKIKCF